MRLQRPEASLDPRFKEKDPTVSQDAEDCCLGLGFEWDLLCMEWVNNSSVLPCLPGLALPSAQKSGWTRAKGIDLPPTIIPTHKFSRALIPSVSVTHFQARHSEAQLWALGLMLFNSLPSSPPDSQGLLCALVVAGWKAACSFSPNTRYSGPRAQGPLWPCSSTKALETRTSEPKAGLRGDPRH